MNLFNCFKCQTEHEVEIQETQDPTNDVEIQDPTNDVEIQEIQDPTNDVEIQEIQDPANQVEIQDQEEQEQNNKHNINKYFETHITYDKNNRKYKYTIYNKDLFYKFGLNKISETNIYTLNDPNKIAIKIRLYDRGNFHIARFVDSVNKYLVLDEDNEACSYLAEFVENNNNDRRYYYALTNPHTPKAYTSKKCPKDGFKIIVSEDKKKHVYECGLSIGN